MLLFSVCPRCHFRMFLAGIYSVLQGDSGLKDCRNDKNWAFSDRHYLVNVAILPQKRNPTEKNQKKYFFCGVFSFGEPVRRLFGGSMRQKRQRIFNLLKKSAEDSVAVG
ncbi:hypothetical protein ISS22_15765 [candidate division KSB1 bacterium]|nr:hypothetical protein [candidate division KSB1 bacterium]